MNSIIEIHRKHKFAHPEQYCAAPGCLSWTRPPMGPSTPCSEHETPAENLDAARTLAASLSADFRRDDT